MDAVQLFACVRQMASLFAFQRSKPAQAEVEKYEKKDTNKG